MLKLRTFGGLSIALDGEGITGAPTQRRRLALLALLAGAGPEGISRDSILGCLWPESEQAKARHVLAQMLYAQRLEMADREMILGTKTLRLNPAVWEVDLWVFEEGRRSGDWAVVDHTYRGAFLQGFHLPAAPDFETWADQQRERLADEAAQALEYLSQIAMSAADAAATVHHLRRAAEIRPYSGHLATRLMRALLAAGDRASAIRHAQSHADLLRRDLELEPDAEVTALADQLRRG